MQDTLLRIYKVSEIEISYRPHQAGEEVKIGCPNDAFEVFIDYWNLHTIQYKETFCVMYMNHAKKVIGIHQHSVGGVSATVVDVKQILGVALKSNASAMILAHNHPSGILRPSQQDIDLTSKIKKACSLLDLTLIDHLIINDHTYYSFTEEGIF